MSLIPHIHTNSIGRKAIYDPNRRHSFIHSNESTINKNKFKCIWPKCGVYLKSQWSFKKHNKSHTNERQFVCDFNDCNKAFNFKEDLKRHKRIHSKEKQFKCDVNECEKSYNSLVSAS